MYANLIRRKLLRKSYAVFIFVAVSIGFLLWLLFRHQHIDSETEYTDDSVKLRLSKDQNEYVDTRGVHVVIGHYLEENNHNGGTLNITDELLNTNSFDPKPNEGKNGQPVIIPTFLATKMRKLYHINRFNLMASDRIPLDRKLPDVRKKACSKQIYKIDISLSVSVIIVFHNEAWSTLLRTVTSVINRSPKSLLKEIVLVDDASTRTFLKESLDDYISHLPVYTYAIHSTERIGLIRSRLLGAQNAKGSILVFLDAHCECTTGWLESLVAHVAEKKSNVACPVIDIINDETFAYVRSFERHLGAFNWDLHFRWYTIGGVKYHRSLLVNKTDITTPFKTPVMAGGLFAINRDYFFEIGSYDDQMKIWGGENLEMSFRVSIFIRHNSWGPYHAQLIGDETEEMSINRILNVWQCGGSINIVPCSHVGHLFRKSSPYLFPGGISEILYSNLIRVALVWMDDWGKFYLKYHADANNLKDTQEVKTRMDLRKNLKCHNFEWYLNNVWPQHFMPMKDRFFGKIRHVVTNFCLEKPTGKSIQNQPSGLASVTKCTSQNNLMQMFVVKYDSQNHTEGIITTDESVCLDVSSQLTSEMKPKIYIVACSGLESQKWIYDEESEMLKHKSTNLCAEVPVDETSLVLSSCSVDAYQKWRFETVPWI